MGLSNTVWATSFFCLLLTVGGSVFFLLAAQQSDQALFNREFKEISELFLIFPKLPKFPKREQLVFTLSALSSFIFELFTHDTLFIYKLSREIWLFADK